MKPALRWLRVPAAILLLGAAVVLAGPQRIWASLSRADPGWILLGLACAVIANLTCALRWRALCGWLGIEAPTGWAIGTYFQGVAVNALLPGAVVGGDVLRAWRLRRLGHPGLEAGLSVVLDRLSGLWMLVVLGAAAFALGMGGAPDRAAATLLRAWPALEALPLAPMSLALAAALFAAPWAALQLAWRLPVAGGTGAAARVRSALARQGLGRPFMVQAALSVVIQALSIGALFCAARALEVDLPAWALAAAAVPVFLMATLPVSFGGWGTREAAAVVALGAFGVPAAAAVGASVIFGGYALVQALAGWRAVREPARPDDLR